MTLGWGLRGVTARRFPAPAAVAGDAAHAGRLDTYLRDLVAPYGLTLTGTAAGGQSYGEMAAALLPGEPVDALVLAYDIPDIEPGRATATWLSHICPGVREAYAVSDQGPAGAHTALRLLSGGGPERALLIVAEQSALPYDSPVAPPAEHWAVAVHLGPSELTATARVHAQVGLEDAAALIGDVGPATLVLGGPLADLDVKAEAVVLADPAQPMTGVWAALAELEGPVVLADYDPRLRYLSVTAFGR